MAPNLSSVEMPLTLVDGLEGNTLDTNGISPVLHIWPVVTRHFSDFWFFLCGESSGYYSTDQFSLSEKHQIFHTSQTELFVNKIAHLRLIYLPFQGPDKGMSTLASVAHESTGWKTLSHNPPPKTIPISAVMLIEASLQCRRRFYEESSEQDLKQAASLTSRSPPSFPIL